MENLPLIVEGEEWRNLVNYTGLYQTSNLGRVKSLERKDALGRTWPERILKPKKGKNGYLEVCLWKYGQMKMHYVHRLAAEAFLDNPMPLLWTDVNHKDENKTNNFVWVNPDGSVDEAKSNLEWCDHKSNLNYGTHNQRMAASKSKQVDQCTLDGQLVRTWASTKECGRNGFAQSAVAACCRNCYLREDNKKYKGFIWRWHSED